ncbi:ABC transporter permease [Halobacterium wangiae]|uniref:ABC transporter permease n=1 Tax=Halobacterium wangiae TaxID=2902623 RepID=UPI001E62058A|nr:ABC transporter permease [Halobacterium wangiae]
MDLSSLLGKELTWGRHKLLALVAILVVLPAVFAYATFGFQHVLPTDAPIAIAPQTAAVTDDDMNIATAAVTVFSDPQPFATEASAMHALGREQVYAVVTVPPNLTDGSLGPAQFDVYVDGSVVPYLTPAQAIENIVAYGLDGTLPRDVEVTRQVVGTEYSLSSYLVPTFVLTLVALVALAYLPYTFDSEAAVLDRLRVETSLHAVVASKLAFFAVLLVVPLVVFDLMSVYMDAGVQVLGVGTIVVTVLTFLLLGLVAATVMLLVGFGAWGRIANLLVLLFVLGFSGLAYPVGFFSPARRWLVRHVPTHYAAISTRGFVLRDDPVELYADWLLGLVGAVLVAALAFAAAVELYERRA